MTRDALENLFVEETRAICSVKRQTLTALAGIANGASAERLGQALTKLLESFETHVERVERIFDVLSRALVEETPQNHARPTSWEAEVLRLIAEGRAAKQIASELGIGSRTVEKYRRRMRAKLGLLDTADVTRGARLAGMVEAGS